MTTSEKRAFSDLLKKPTDELVTMKEILSSRPIFSKSESRTLSSLNVILADRAAREEMTAEADLRFPNREVAFDKYQSDFRAGTQVLWLYKHSPAHAGGKLSVGTIERGFRHATDP
jgi:hypothetical protein